MDPKEFKSRISKLRNVDPNSISLKDGNKYFNIAVRLGDVELASKLLYHKKADVNYCDEFSMLHVAVNRKDAAMVRLLTSFQVDANPCVNSNRSTISPLWAATAQDNDEIVELLIKAGANVNERTAPFEVTFLHMAAASGNKRRVNLLLDHGADINSKNVNGKSVLQYALLDGGCETTELLLRRGADANSTDDNGMTALHQASSNDDKSVVSLLLKYGADISMIDNEGSNALHYIAASESDNAELTELLLKSGTPVNGTNSTNLTPLHCVVVAEKFEMVNLMIQYGADVQSKSAVSGIFPLFISVQSGNVHLAKLLLDNGALINEITFDSKTALHQACMQGIESMVRLLVDYGADVDALNHEGNTPLMNLRLANDYDIYVAAILIRKIAMLENKASEVNLKFIDSEPMLKQIYDEYHEEIEKMKRVKLGENLSFSYYFVFAKDHRKIVNLARNEEFVKGFETREYYKHFPLYAQEMERKFERAKKVSEKIMASEDMLCEAVGHYLPLTFIKNVAHMMYYED